MFKDPDDADYWAFRAEEARTKAGDMKTPQNRCIMMEISEEYERLAVLAKVRTAEAASARTLDDVLELYRKT